MRCDDVRRELLDLDLNEAGRRRVAEMPQHAERCADCRQALGDFDRLRAVVAAPDAPDEPAGGWSAFETRMARGLRHQRWVGKQMPMALAASVLLAVAGWGLYLKGRPNNDHDSTKPSGPLAMALSPQDVSQGVSLFDQVSNVFEHRTDWVLVSNGSSDLGVGSKAPDTGGKLLFVRLTLTSGRVTESTADLVIDAGRTAATKVNTLHGHTIRYQVNTSAKDPARLRIGLYLENDDIAEPEMAAIVSDLNVQPGQIMPAGNVVTPAGQYQLNVEVCPARAQHEL